MAKKKPMTAAERDRKRRERINANPALREAYLAKKRQKAKEAYVKIRDRPEREQRKLRRKWRANYKAKKKNAAMVKSTLENTPPTTPEASIHSEQSTSHKTSGTSPGAVAKTCKCKRLSKVVTSLKFQVEFYKKSSEKYRKRLRRLEKKMTEDKDQVPDATPRTNVRRILRKEYGRSPKMKEVRRKLFGQAIVADSIRQSSQKLAVPALKKYVLTRKDGWKCAMSKYLGRDGSHRLRSSLGGDIHKKRKRQSRHEQVIISGVFAGGGGAQFSFGHQRGPFPCPLFGTISFTSSSNF